MSYWKDAFWKKYPDYLKTNSWRKNELNKGARQPEICPKNTLMLMRSWSHCVTWLRPVFNQENQIWKRQILPKPPFFWCFSPPPPPLANGSVQANRALSCTRLRVPHVALHVSRYTCCSWFPGLYSVLQVQHRCRATPPKNFGVAPPPPCAGRCRTEIWVWKGVALHGGVAATVAGVALHCATKTALTLSTSRSRC